MADHRDTTTSAEGKGDETVSSASVQNINIKSITGVKHRLSQLVNDKTSQYASYIFEPVESGVWSVVHREDDLTVYRREAVGEGTAVDPLKATYTVQGLSAEELTRFFFAKDGRLEWQSTLESVDVVETLADDTVIFHQRQKRIWPASQREGVFCSHLCTLEGVPRPENMVGDTWMVCNFSVDHDSVPINSKLVRATVHAGLVCQTIASNKRESGKEDDLHELTRNNISCQLQYALNVNLGGWVPASIVKAGGKRELPKVLKKLCECCHKKVSTNPLSL